METYNAILELLLGATGLLVIGSAVYMVLAYGASGAWAKRIEIRNLVSGPLIFGLMLLGLRYAPSLTMQSTTFGINRAADDTPALKEALSRLLNEVKDPAERAFNIDGADVTIGTAVPDDPYAVVITSTPTAFPIDFSATGTAFAQQFPTAVPPESTPMAPTATPTERPTAAPGDPDWWGHDRPPTPVSGGARGWGN